MICSTSRVLAVLLFAIPLIPAVAQQRAVTWINSTADKPWQSMPAPAMEPSRADRIPEVRVSEKTFQTIDGFGGCFNELGWDVLLKLPAAERERAMRALFGDDGCAFTLARIPIGASDFALDGYSLDDVRDDYELKQFSIERDRKLLLPFIKSAMEIRPELQCWASPWSPPAWMKTNNSYAKGSLRWETPVLESYANYFVKWIEAYRAEGVKLYAITPQNEPNILNVYPTCLWTGDQLREFIGEHLGPTLKARNAQIELWVGFNGDPPNQGDNANARLVPVLDDPKASAFLTGIAFQYDSRNQIAVAAVAYPDKKLMQSETECNAGNNSWADAQKLYALINRYLSHNANSYFAWNMVLDPSGMSTWKWKQNALITADATTGKIRLNGEYYVMRHFSQYVKPGAKRVLTTGVWGDKIAFVNPDGSTVLVIGNSAKSELPVTIRVPGKNADNTMTVKLPPESINTFVVPN